MIDCALIVHASSLQIDKSEFYDSSLLGGLQNKHREALANLLWSIEPACSMFIHSGAGVSCHGAAQAKTSLLL